MIDLAIALALSDAGFGVYGENVFWNQTPVNETASIPADGSLWVTATTVSSARGVLTDQITISTRYPDSVAQGNALLHVMRWIDGTLADACVLSCKPVADVDFKIVGVGASRAVDLDSVDEEGRFVKSVSFQLSYQLPDVLPEIQTATL